MSIDTATTMHEIAALRSDYERLGAASGNRLPFALHEWHVTWCEHIMNCDPRVHEEPMFHVLRDAQGVCNGIIPFIASERKFGPLKVGSVTLLGADPALTEIRSPLVEPGFEHLAARASRDVLIQRDGWDWVHWTGLSQEFENALRVLGALKWQPSLADFVLDLPATWEEFRSRLRRNIRESLRHGYNSLKRDGYTFTLDIICAPGEVHQGLECFLRLHRLRSQLKHTVIHEDRFASRVSRAFLFAVCERLAARGVLRLFALRIGKEIVAMRLGFVVGDSLYLYYSGFDPRWWRYGVMTTTVAEAIKYAIAHQLKTVNLSAGWDIPKARWSPRQVDYGSAFELRPRLRSRVMNGAYLRARADDGSARLFGHLIRRRHWE